MKQKFKYLFILSSLLLIANLSYAQKKHTLKSPDGKISVVVDIDKENIEYAVNHNADVLINASPMAVKLTNGKTFGTNPKLSKVETKSVNQKIYPPIYKKNEIIDNYNELILKFKDNYNIIFRAYDDGIAYRFVYTGKSPINIENEIVQYNLPADQKAYIPYAKGRNGNKTLDEQFYSAFQNTYEHISVSEWQDKRLAFAPILIEAANGKKSV